ncbi:hypothetical protein [Streptosporangium sandarakinum]|uniref:hypothetical protein n=1 Tax=Streptosporangium sandarakinum TaxID=1260955 RepID=UPI003712142F
MIVTVLFAVPLALVGWMSLNRWPLRGPVTAATLRLIPYHRWGDRGPVSMRVWLPAT